MPAQPSLSQLCRFSSPPFVHDIFQLGQHIPLSRLAAPAASYTILADLEPFGEAEGESVLDGAVVVKDVVVAKVCWVVTVDAQVDAGV